MEYRRMVKPWVLVLSLLHVRGSAALCSASERSTNLTACLGALLSAFDDTSSFWFGTSYNQDCPFDAPVTINCYNSRGLSRASLSSAIFPDGDFSPDTVDRFLQVSFTSAPGEYNGCGHQYRSESRSTFDVDPLDDDVIRAWDARDLPEVTWTTENDKQYTLVIQDPATGHLPLFYINIPGNRLEEGNIVKTYSGLIPTKTVRNPFVFLLFEQNHDLDVAPDNDTQRVYSVDSLIQTLSLIGPKAISWVNVDFDPYAAETLRRRDFMENCSPFVTAELSAEDVQFQDLDLANPLPGFAEVSIKPTDTLNFEFCCQQNSYPPVTVAVDAIGGPVLSPVSVRNEASVDIILSMTGIFPNRTRDFRDKLFTVAMFDPDIPPTFSDVGSDQLPLLHWLSYNMSVSHQGYLSGGTVDKSYRGPRPRDASVHSYYVMVYEQPGSLTLDSGAYSGDSCPERIADRCRFNVRTFVSDNNLQLFAASWLKAQNDDFVNFVTNANQSVLCVGRPTYKVPCDSPSASSQITSYSLIVFLVIRVFVY